MTFDVNNFLLLAYIYIYKTIDIYMSLSETVNVGFMSSQKMFSLEA